MDFLATNALYLVLFIALICWFGIMGFLIRIDKRITTLEQQQGNGKKQ